MEMRKNANLNREGISVFAFYEGVFLRLISYVAMPFDLYS
ncbi:putative membrane protein [Brevibacillus laterosporus GI-9]|nr:putative membrane protein [Brevibacillus laterosporus GI-9]